MEIVLDVILDALLDSFKLLPFLFLTYLFMEFLEHKAGDKTRAAMIKAGRVGPLFGAGLGLLPQCGFSAAAAGLYAGRVVTVGTLLAVFLATSDEMLPVFIGEGVPIRVILTVLGCKFVLALVVGFAADLIVRRRPEEQGMVDLCRQEHCHCENGILRSALHHTLHVFLFVLLINLALTGTFAAVGEERVAAMMNGVPVLGECVAALIGLVPNCAASVAIATLYVKGVISAGAMLAGLLTGAGAGLLILFRTNRHHWRENLLIVAALYLTGVAFGSLFDLTGLADLLHI